MKTMIKCSILIATLLIAFSACKKEGTDGEATVATIVQHHGKNIPYSMVYVKYGAKDFPGDDVSKYDSNQKTDKEGHTHFKGLQRGDYFFYAVGYDSASAATVKGGVNLKISRKEKKSELEQFVPVTE